MSSRRVIVVGGGAAGFFAAITCAEAAPDVEVMVLERGPRFLSKVRISGGGRCNVTHACFDARELATRFPRGQQALIGPFQRFQPSDTVAWFAARGVQLKTESDGRMFPITDSSQTIIDCLLSAAKNAGVVLVPNRSVHRATKSANGKLDLELSNGEKLTCDRLLLVTHWGLSGPVILRLSAWGARQLHQLDYRFTLRLNWLPQLSAQSIAAELNSRRKLHPARLLVNTPFAPLTARL